MNETPIRIWINDDDWAPQKDDNPSPHTIEYVRADICDPWAKERDRLRSERDQATHQAQTFSNEISNLQEDLRAQIGATDQRRAERDAYRKAKCENDERYIVERDQARAEVERLLQRIAALEARGK